jgi:1-acyl-sn-glycerol-3-phosphate acyltransferase
VKLANPNRSDADRMRRQHAIQRELGRLVAIVWVPLAVLVLRYGFGYRIQRLQHIRREFKRIRSETKGPLVICANHLTMIDSFLIAWALAPPWEYVLNFDLLAWNTPERTNFASTLRNRILAYFAKCIPITRGGQRDQVGAVLDRVIHLLSLREIALLFPEGGRSRTGRVEPGEAAWGVGRVIGALPGCRIVCVYLRGEHQETWGHLPAKGDEMYVDIACIEPKSDSKGVRRSMDFARQVIAQLVRMEQKYFDGRK